jgi:hypothetical protein
MLAPPIGSVKAPRDCQASAETGVKPQPKLCKASAEPVLSGISRIRTWSRERETRISRAIPTQQVAIRVSYRLA